MSDEELDALARRALLEALRLDWEERLETAPEAELSSRHRRQMRAMLADPWGWMRKRTRPMWKKVAQRAAAVLLACALSLGGLMAVSPTVRAQVLGWVAEWYKTHVFYRYSGEPAPEVMPRYEVTKLPEGYGETGQYEMSGYVSITYQNQEGSSLRLDYSFMQQGAGTDILTENMEVTEVTVNGFAGQFFLSLDPKQSNAVTWIDPVQNLQFMLDGFFDKPVLLHMAESVSLVNPTK